MAATDAVAETVDAEAREAVTAPPLLTPRRVIGVAALVLFALFVIPVWLGAFWLQVVTTVVIWSSVTLGLGLLIGRAGMVSLCQVPLFAIGAWVALRFDYLSGSIPFPVLLLLAGLITGLIGILIGLPALRLQGLYLALITLMAAGAITVVLRRAQFPNGGSGFFANDRAGGVSSLLPRPGIAEGDTAYYRYCVIVTALMFLLAAAHVLGRPGRAWAAIRQSQVTAVAAGVNTTLYKLWCFALASFVTGVAGGLLAAGRGGVSIEQFPIQNTIILLAVVMMGGVFSLYGAIVGALLLRFLPAFLDNPPFDFPWIDSGGFYMADWSVSTELLTILFGVGILQVILTAPAGLVEQVPKDLANLGRKIGSLFDRPTDAHETLS